MLNLNYFVQILLNFNEISSKFHQNFTEFAESVGNPYGVRRGFVTRCHTFSQNGGSPLTSQFSLETDFELTLSVTWTVAQRFRTIRNLGSSILTRSPSRKSVRHSGQVFLERTEFHEHFACSCNSRYMFRPRRFNIC